MKITESHYIDVENILSQLFKEVYFNPITELFTQDFYNSTNYILDQIARGNIVYKDGKFTGKFNIKISKELSKFSKFDMRSKSFKVKDITAIPKDILSTSTNANMQSERLHKELEKRIDGMSIEMQKRIKEMSFPINKTADEIERALMLEQKSIGIEYKLNKSITDRMIQQYNGNMKLNIVDEINPQQSWNEVEVQRLRDMVTKSALKGFNKKTLIEMIQNEFETSQKKAKFLARQETSLFLSNLRDERYIDAGVQIYQWMGSNDIRQVGNPSGLYPKGTEGHGNHWRLNRKYCRYDDDSVYAESLEDVKNKIWKSRSNIGCPDTSPGREFLCRCGTRPILIKL